jgi:hypothetical protein
MVAMSGSPVVKGDLILRCPAQPGLEGCSPHALLQHPSRLAALAPQDEVVVLVETSHFNDDDLASVVQE